MSLQICTDITEAVPLETSLGLYLKPASKIKISVQLPKLKTPGQSISTWQVMEKLRSAVRPDQFLFLKALKITPTVIKFLGELETKAASDRALARLKAAGGINLPGFTEWLQIRGTHAACAGPTRHDWDSFFRDARGVDEMKPGERPDTVHLQDLPSSWFAESSTPSKPSEHLLHKAFSTFGRIRRLEIPTSASSSDDQTIGKTSSLFKDLTFQVYIQYEEYVEFATAMDSLRGKKLLHKDTSDGKVQAAEIKVDFDRTNYLSEKNIKKRELETKKITTTVTSNLDITKKENSSDKNKCLGTVKEERIIQDPEESKKEAKIEATLLLKELLKRSETYCLEGVKRKEKKNQDKLIHQEQVLKEKLLRSLKLKEKEKALQIREKLRKELAGQKLISVLANVNYRTIGVKNTFSEKHKKKLRLS